MSNRERRQPRSPLVVLRQGATQPLDFMTASCKDLADEWHEAPYTGGSPAADDPCPPGRQLPALLFMVDGRYRPPAEGASRLGRSGGAGVLDGSPAAGSQQPGRLALRRGRRDPRALATARAVPRTFPGDVGMAAGAPAAGVASLAPDPCGQWLGPSTVESSRISRSIWSAPASR